MKCPSYIKMLGATFLLQVPPQSRKCSYTSVPSPANPNGTGYEILEVASADTRSKHDLGEEMEGGEGRGEGEGG